MVTKTTKSKASLVRNNICKFCNKGFSSEKILISHMCVKKRRYKDKDTPGARIGFRVFQRFYELTTSSKNLKTEVDFINSRYYISFVKFGRYLIQLNSFETNGFIDFLIMNSVPLKVWENEEVYEQYLKMYVKKELPEKAFERTINTMVKWGKENNDMYNNFFKNANTIEATFLIRSGHISPWILYLSSAADDLFSRLSNDQGELIERAIDPEYWEQIISSKKEDVKFIVNILEKAKL